MGRRRPKVLIVDGDREVSLALHRVLYEGSENFDILLAGSADVARDIMRDISIDVLVTDVDLPGASGVDLVCWGAIEFPETLFVVQTSDDVSQSPPWGRASPRPATPRGPLSSWPQSCRVWHPPRIPNQNRQADPIPLGAHAGVHMANVAS
jgi:hypothetical protein